MKIQPVIAVILFALVGYCLMAQTTAPDSTKGLFNGRLWSDMDLHRKLAWMEGYEDGVVMGAMGIGKVSAKDFADAYSGYIATGLSIGEQISGVDHFYADTPENAPVSIADALAIVSLKASGAPPPVVEDFTAKFRRAAESRTQQ